MAKILIVDDSASMRNMVSATLTSVGHQVIDAEDGQIGFTKANSTQFDLVVSDVNMPVLNGIELVRQLRKYNFLQVHPDTVTNN